MRIVETPRKSLKSLDNYNLDIADRSCRIQGATGRWQSMRWLFHRSGEYLYCEARTCLEDSGFEIVVESAGRVRCEWFADETQLTRRWERLNRELRLEGWADCNRVGR
jgi:hypothetical protein